jgi:HK97 family phage prohead protease
MPIPKPNKDEEKDKFMERCMSNNTMNNEYPDEKQRYAICLTQWDNKDKKDFQGFIEHRNFPLENLEIRIREDGTEIIAGYSAVFNKSSVNLGWFTEQIKPGAFTNALKKSDARALFNHDVNYVLGRQSSNTLILREDEKGLFMEVIPPQTQIIKDLVLSPIRRGDIREQSFGFIVKEDSWREGDKNDLPLRTIIEIDELFDVSPVTFPAYPDTSIALRSFTENKNVVTDIQNKKGETSYYKNKIDLCEQIIKIGDYLK